MTVMLRGRKAGLALEEERQDRILLGYLTWGEFFFGRTEYLGRDTSFPSMRRKLSPFLFCAHTAGMAKEVTAVFCVCV